ncbi:dinucleotide-utilizing protein [Dokdonia sp. Dokd-P16]|uniref:HesA/MoeB/ThiF family protein n=1 Tax=Dokdonia sp. Dokd-P16 TaxID=2173169 RepID=UPI000D5461C2|nr:HesA/MoeB/ThiF family protein [Dokdonia sp. Dokd-P16]AWH75220.1 dinucleotide-utilizing protein [Dokdonia sp. Dokd-P16]
MELTTAEKQQYSRHLILDEIGLAGQLKIKDTSVLVIGAGGLGCPVLQYLTAAGIGRIGIIDKDVVEQSNLQRQILYTHDDIGSNKAISVTRRLERLNPYIKFDTYPMRLTRDNALELFANYDIIVDGSDNFATRYLVNDAAILKGKPVVLGSIYKFEGQLAVYNYKNGPTYRCLYPTPPKQNEMPNCSEAGVLGALAGIIGSLQANEVLKIICGIGEVLSGKLLTYNMITMNQMILGFEKDTSIIVNRLEDEYELQCEFSVDNMGIIIDEINKHSEKYNLLDVREHHERAVHHIGGQHIPLGELQSRIQEVLQNKDLVVYCKAGVRSKKAIELLQKENVKCSLLYLTGTVL